MPSILSVDDFEAIVQTGLDAAVIKPVIEREEAALVLRVGPLVGERTDLIHPPVGWDRPLTLRRFAASATVAIAGVELDAAGYRLVSDGAGRLGGCLERVDAVWSGDEVAVTSEPSALDAELLRRYLIEAVRAALVPDRERTAASDRTGAAVHRDNQRLELRRLLRDVRPTHHAAPLLVGAAS